MDNSFPKGSEWRKWDLQIHAPQGKLYDGYKTEDNSDILDKFCEEIENSEVQVFGITDYFSVSSFNTFIERFKTKYPNSKKMFFFNLELRLNETVNRELEEVNTHLLFNPSSLEKVDKFLSMLSVVKTGKDETPIKCSELKSPTDFESATVTRASITEAFEETFGKKAERQEHFVVITAANNDGLRPERGKQRKEGICDEIDKFSDAFFGGSQNVQYYLRSDRYEDKTLVALKKPVLACSDAHSFQDISNFLGRQFVKEIQKGDSKTEILEKDIAWIKADKTFNGLKQILYEPESGERIYVGGVKPDQKDDYRVINKIKFQGSKDFPQEIILNENLCSIIGSRSSGKSAFLAYIAHAVNPKAVEAITTGPGEGKDYHWNKIPINYSIEWANGKSNTESSGNIVYVPQNYLFDKSKDPNEIKVKIQPVLFKTLPDFANQYTQTIKSIDGFNNEISDNVTEWFTISDEIKTLDIKLKEQGDKSAVQNQQKDTAEKIQSLSEKNKLSESDLKIYQEVSAQISSYSNRIKEIDNEVAFINSVFPFAPSFSSARITLTPSLVLLPAKLQELLNSELTKAQSVIIQQADKITSDYREALIKEKIEIETTLQKIKEEHKELIEKYQKNAELERLISLMTEYAGIIKKIERLQEQRKLKDAILKKLENFLKSTMEARKKVIEQLGNIDSSDQSSIVGIKFGVEYDFYLSDLHSLAQRINLKSNTDYVDKGEIQMNSIRNNTAKFLSDVYSGNQKLIINQNKKDVAIEAFKLTEKILFTAEMEGDKIGGFSEPTMTPGKRALFALRLILAESDDTWPLLIDQPEDDLDSRSIYNEVVPFLKKKKKERQIIMVSHNANLVIGSDSEQLIIANRHGNDRKNEDGIQFNYLTGSLEFNQEFDGNCKDTLKAQGVCEHACSILDGGKMAFENRKNKYHI